jgi:hypothetical protein
MNDYQVTHSHKIPVYEPKSRQIGERAEQLQLEITVNDPFERAGYMFGATSGVKLSRSIHGSVLLGDVHEALGHLEATAAVLREWLFDHGEELP